MPSPTEITVLQLARLVGLPGAPAIVDVRKDEEFKSDPRLVPTARRHSCPGGTEWCRRYGGQPIVVVCQTGRTRSQATAAQLRHEGLDAKTLEGGHEAWCEARQPLVRAERIPPPDKEGRTVWVTRARPQSTGLLASCLGYLRMYRDDLAQLAAAMPQFDALYRWSRDASDERHG